jgi:alpha-galactosidase
MVKIAVIGAGSLVFTRKLVSDLLQQEPTADAEIRLMDIDTGRLKEVGEVVEAIVDQSHSKARVTLTNDTAEAGEPSNWTSTSPNGTGYARRSPIRMVSGVSPVRPAPSHRSWPSRE